MSKRLIISYSYQPLIGPRSFRWTTIAEHWYRQGMHVDVIAAARRGLAAKETVNGVRVHRVGGTLVERLRSTLSKSDPYAKKELQQDATSHNPSRPGMLGSLAARTASAVHHGVWKHIWWPDVRCLWYFAVVRQAAQLVAEHHYDGMVTSSPLFTAHVAGYRLKKKYSGIKWLVDIGDPFCFAEDDLPNNRRLYGSWNYTFERRVFNRADSISVTTRQTAAQYASLFPESADRIAVLPPLVSDHPASNGTAPVFPDDDKIRLMFAGSLYRHNRRPDFMLRLLNSLLETSLKGRLELHFFGNTENCAESFVPYEHLLNDKIFVHGLVGRDRALLAMEESDVLVNISNNTRYQLPSKVVEYANTGKPVINVAGIENDSSAEVFQDYPSALCLLDKDGTPTARQIEDVRAFLQNLPSPLDRSMLEAWMERFKIDAIAAQYESLLS
jgi:glycosyltransferase involved in cell wall biosynthesis